MIIQLLLLLTGFVVLTFSSNFLVKHSVSFSKSIGVSTLIIGLTVIAFGTSLPELVVNILAALQLAGDLGIGNILGSNIANIGLVVGVTALIKPLKPRKALVKFELPSMIFITLILYGLSLDQQLSRTDGLILCLLGIIFNFIIIKTALKQSQNNYQKEDTVYKNAKLFRIIKILISIGGMILGAELIIKAAVYIATEFGISQLFIGITVLAVGTSLPELATGISATLRGEEEISVGTIIGSNIMNISFVLGLTAIILPLSIPAKAISVDILAVIIFSLLLLFSLLLFKKFNRMLGGIYCLGYLIYIFISYKY